MLRLVLRLVRALLWGTASLAIVLALYLAATFFGAQIVARGNPPEPSGEAERIYLLTSLLHADFAIAVDDALRARFAFLGDAGVPIGHENLKYLVFGWGAREFYLNTPTLSQVRPVPAVRGIFGDSTVMHVMAATDVSKAPSSVAVTLPPGGREKLLSFIEASFARSGNSTLPITGRNYGMADAFYVAEGGFNILTPCNIWVAKGLRQAGLDTGAWTPTTWSLLRGLALHSPQALNR